MSAYTLYMLKSAGKSPYAHLPLDTPGVRAVVVNGEGKVLLLRRPETSKMWPGTWNLPGGNKEPGESFLSGAARELLEETTLQAKARKGRGFRYDFLPHLRGHGYAYVFDHPGGEIVSPAREVAEHGWFHPSDLPENLFPNTKSILDNLLQGKAGM